MPEAGLYRGGWIASTDVREINGGPEDLQRITGRWGSHPIGTLKVRHDDTFTVSSARIEGAQVLLLGIAMDVERPDRGQDEVVLGLAQRLASSWESFLDGLDSLSGAHVVFTFAEGRLRVLQDATGMEPVCYDASGATGLLASHPALIAELAGYAPSEWGSAWLEHPILRAGGVYFPGIRTLFDEVRILTPNTLLDVGTREVERFFPREPLGILEPDEILDRVVPLLTGQLRWLSDRYPCAVSFSGGIDSRLTVAASHEVADRMRYFTYIYGAMSVHLNDAEVASRIAERAGLEHEVYRLSLHRGVQRDFLATWDRVHRGTQTNGKLQAALQLVWPEGHLHLRSNVLETMRGFFLKNSINHPDRFDAMKLARLFRTTVSAEFEPYFAEFAAVTDFTPERKLDYHYSDLFYWEHRMGAWHGPLVRGFKAVHNSYVIYNCRRILSLLMARPLEDRAAGLLVFQLIERLWPEMLEERIYSGSHFIRNPLTPAPAAVDGSSDGGAGTVPGRLDRHPGRS